MFGEMAVDILEVLIVTSGLQNQDGSKIMTDLRKFGTISNILQMPHNI